MDKKYMTVTDDSASEDTNVTRTEEDQDADDDETESINPFAAPSIPASETDSPDEYYPRDIVIIPKVIVRKIEKDAPEETSNEDFEESKEDKHQHFFIDQVHFVRPTWPGTNEWWYPCAAVIAFMVDFANLTAMPNHVANHGGFVFLAVYCIVVVSIVYPMLYLELLIGQYFETGMIGIWGIAPIGRGLGAGLFYLNFMVLAILPPNILWASFMMGDAMKAITTGDLVWVYCYNDWNTCRCENTRQPICLDPYDNHSSIATLAVADASTHELNNNPTFEYYVGRVLQMWKTKYSDPIVIKDIRGNGDWSTAYGFTNEREGLGPLVPASSLAILFIYILIVFLSTLPLRLQGYFYIFSTGFTVLVIGLLVCRGLSLDGAYNGLFKYFLKFEAGKLFEFSTWYTALESAFFSATTGYGCHLFITSCNPLDTNCRRIAVVSIIVDTLTSVLSCLMAYMYVGHTFATKRIPLPEKFPGEHFVFIGLAESLGGLSAAGFFATIFYFMLMLMSLDTHVVVLQALAFSLYEEFKRKYPHELISKNLFFFSVWGFAFCFTLAITTRGGFWLYRFFVDYCFGLTGFVFMLVEIIIFAWFWGLQEICIAVETINGHRPGFYLRLCWKYILPIVLTGFLIIANFLHEFEPFTVFGQSTPVVNVKLGFTFQYLSAALVLLYPVYVFFRIRTKGMSCKHVLMLLISPEYDHDEIRADINNATRLHRRHYLFFRFDDENREINAKNYLLSGIQKMKGRLGLWKKKKKPGADGKGLEADPGGSETTVVRTKKEKKKKNKQSKTMPEGDQEQTSAWDLWHMAKQEMEQQAAPEVKKKEAPKGNKKKPRYSHFRGSTTNTSSAASSKSSSKAPKKVVPSKVTAKHIKPVRSVNKVKPAHV